MKKIDKKALIGIVAGICLMVGAFIDAIYLGNLIKSDSRRLYIITEVLLSIVFMLAMGGGLVLFASAAATWSDSDNQDSDNQKEGQETPLFNPAVTTIDVWFPVEIKGPKEKPRQLPKIWEAKIA